MEKITQAEVAAMSPNEYRHMLREGEWSEPTSTKEPWPCQGNAQANLVVVPEDYAFEFMRFCQRNPRPCPVLDVTDPGEPHFKIMAPEADLRTDVSKYRVFKDGELIDEPIDIIKYWKDSLVGFLIGCSCTIEQALRAANISWRRYGLYHTTIPCVPAGRFYGNMVVTVRAFFTVQDAVRAVQVSSRHQLMHGAPVHIGDPAAIGIEKLGQPDPFYPSRPAADPPKPGEVVMCWGCGVTPQGVAMERKIPFMITHSPSHMFIIDRRVEEMAVI